MEGVCRLPVERSRDCCSSYKRDIERKQHIYAVSRMFVFIAAAALSYRWEQYSDVGLV